MPEQKELPLSDLELVYLNGQEHGAPPVFKDVRLSRDSQKICEDLLARAKQQDKRIRSESELKRCHDTISLVRACIKQLKWLKQNERKPWIHICSQIDTGITGIEHQFLMVESELRARMEAWRTEVEMGRQKQAEDLKREALELEQKAKYDSDPQSSRQAKVRAKEKRAEVKEFEKLKPAPGLATVVDYECEIENRQLAAKLPQEAVYMECRNDWFKAKIKEAKAAGLPIPIFPGIRITVKTAVRLYK
jgi:hypothetical protein